MTNLNIIGDSGRKRKSNYDPNLAEQINKEVEARERRKNLEEKLRGKKQSQEENKQITPPSPTITPPPTITRPTYSGQLVTFHNHELVREEYDALTSIAERYFKKTAEDYFSNLTDTLKSLYLSIQDKHVRRLDMLYQELKEIPREINLLAQLQELYLYNNQIQRIENLDNLAQLQILNLNNNQIQRNSPQTQQELTKLKDRGVNVGMWTTIY